MIEEEERVSGARYIFSPPSLVSRSVAGARRRLASPYVVTVDEGNADVAVAVDDAVVVHAVHGRVRVVAALLRLAADAAVRPHRERRGVRPVEASQSTPRE